MRYPSISLGQCKEIVQARIGGRDVQVPVRWAGSGDEVDLDRIAAAAKEIDSLRARDWGSGERDYVEGLAATHLYQALRPDDARPVDVAVLDDPGFWRFLGLRFLWDFIKWREPSVLSGTHMEYVDGQRSSECVPTRMYLRVAAVGGLEFAEHSERLERATDFWRSHILRVRTGTAPALTRAIVSRQARQPIETGSLRPFAKQVNGAWTNVLLNMYDDAEAERFVDEFWPGQA